MTRKFKTCQSNAYSVRRFFGFPKYLKNQVEQNRNDFLNQGKILQGFSSLTILSYLIFNNGDSNALPSNFGRTV